VGGVLHAIFQEVAWETHQHVLDEAIDAKGVDFRSTRCQEPPRAVAKAVEFRSGPVRESRTIPLSVCSNCAGAILQVSTVRELN
jgi:hypothetical protein